MTNVRDWSEMAASVASTPERLFHYTNLVGLEAILRAGGLINRLVSDSEDEDEMRVAASILDEPRTMANGRPATRADLAIWARCHSWATHKPELGMTCFTEDENSESLWTFPSPDEPTVALELEMAPLFDAARLIDPDAILLRCNADETTQRQQVDELLERASRLVEDGRQLTTQDEASLRAECEKLAGSLVYSGFGGESEWRLLLLSGNRTNGRIVLTPTEPPLLRVLIQPGRESCEEEVRSILGRCGWQVTGDDVREPRALIVAKA